MGDTVELSNLLEELEAVYRGRQTGSYHIRRIAGQAKAKLERYNELFKWSNENCTDCAEGRVPRHPQTLPDPDSTNDRLEKP